MLLYDIPFKFKDNVKNKKIVYLRNDFAEIWWLNLEIKKNGRVFFTISVILVLENFEVW